MKVGTSKNSQNAKFDGDVQVFSFWPKIISLANLVQKDKFV